jgi:hypothetical protein
MGKDVELGSFPRLSPLESPRPTSQCISLSFLFGLEELPRRKSLGSALSPAVQEDPSLIYPLKIFGVTRRISAFRRRLRRSSTGVALAAWNRDPNLSSHRGGSEGKNLRGCSLDASGACFSSRKGPVLQASGFTLQLPYCGCVVRLSCE